MTKNTQPKAVPPNATDLYFTDVYERAAKGIKANVGRAMERSLDDQTGAPEELDGPRTVIAAYILAMAESIAAMITMSSPEDRDPLTQVVADGFARGRKAGDRAIEKSIKDAVKGAQDKGGPRGWDGRKTEAYAEAMAVINKIMGGK